MATLLPSVPASARRGRPRLLSKRRSALPAGPAPRVAVPAPAPRKPAAPSLALLIAQYTATFGTTWKPTTRRKHRDDFGRLLDWLTTERLPATTDALEFAVLARYVEQLRERPAISGVWRGAADARTRSASHGLVRTLSANTVNSYVRPIRSLCIWLVDEGVLGVNPFRRSRRRASLNPLLPSEETPTKSATLADLQAVERGCAGERPLDLRDRAIVSVLVTTAARNSSVRLLRLGDVDAERAVIRFRRAKGGKTLDVALHPDTRATILAFLERGRPALVAAVFPGNDPGYLFPAAGSGTGAPLSMNALSLMLTRRYRAGGGSLPYFGSHRIRHATATLLINNGMGLEEVSRYLGHSSTDVTRRYAQQTPAALGLRAADALARAGVAGA